MPARQGDFMNQEEAKFMQLLEQAANGDHVAKNQFGEMVYAELRKVAMRAVGGGQIEPTSIVNEFVQKRMLKTTYLAKMINKRYFYGAAFNQMRNLLIDRARKRKPVPLADQGLDELDSWLERIEQDLGYDIEALNIEIEKLQDESPRQYEVIQARFWGGLTIKDTAELLEVSVGTVENDFRLARAKILRALQRRER